MNLLSIFGQLPASNSTGGELNKLDYMKLIRMGSVLVVSYCAVAIIEAVMRDLSNGAFGIPVEFTTPITGILSILLEAVRRKMTEPSF